MPNSDFLEEIYIPKKKSVCPNCGSSLMESKCNNPNCKCDNCNCSPCEC